MKFKKLLLLLLAASVVTVSCNKDDEGSNEENIITGEYANGLFVLNEGNSNVSTASVTFIGNNGTVQQDIYNGVNPGSPLTGSYLQSMFFDDERAFIISGQANKITVVNRYTFEFIASIDSNFSSPRYGAIVGNKAYVTNYADFNIGTDDFLTVIDLTDYSTSVINMNNWSEKITEFNNKLYIANGYFGEGTSLTIFNPVTNSTEKIIELGISPDSMDEEDGILYVAGDNKIIKINLSDNQVISTVTLPQQVSDARNINVENGVAYFTSNTTVYKMNTDTATAEVAFTYESDSDFGGMYGFAVKEDKIYIAEGGDFASDSEIYIYSLTGTLLNTIPAGVGPNGFYFN